MNDITTFRELKNALGAPLAWLIIFIAFVIPSMLVMSLLFLCLALVKFSFLLLL